MTRWLADAVADARERTLDLVADLDDEQLMGPKLPIVNPLHWEIGHVAWFQEFWVLRRAGKLQSILEAADTLYDSTRIPHVTRWDLPLPSREETIAYMRRVRDRVLERLSEREPAPEETYFVLLTLFHEDMHDEAFTYTRQTLAYPPPRISRAWRVAGEAGTRGSPAQELVREPVRRARRDRERSGPFPGDASLAGGRFPLGAARGEPFVFDNEKWAHEVEVGAFAISKATVTQADFARFVDDGGYRSPENWSAAGWRWRESAGAEHPLYWRREPDGSWRRRDFDVWLVLEPHRPVIHVNWYEAEAWCRWAGRRLPTEAEWEIAASWDPASGRKRRFPWGDDPPTPERANLEGARLGCADVGALSTGDSPSGCRQMIGNVWEWTASDFAPYPGFAADPYKEYSEPWFHSHKVLRGGAWATRARLLRNTWRNFYEPDRRDVWAGFRTCAIGAK